MPNPTSFQTFKSYNLLQGFAFQSWIIQKNLIRPPLPPLHLLLQCLISAPRLIYDSMHV